jgi:uncharacterized protein YqjF (DUF2071 family)
MKMDSAPVFLMAEWRHLAMLNYEADPKSLTPFVPVGTELDLWEGRNFISVVGFLFQKTRVLGIPIPFHRDFEEVNLRFYVRRNTPDGWRRGVVFIKELVPRTGIAWTARTFYNEPYLALPMSHQIETAHSRALPPFSPSPPPKEERAGERRHHGFRLNSPLPSPLPVWVGRGRWGEDAPIEASPKSVAYFWRFNGKQNHLKLVVRGAAQPLQEGSQQEFITEHYWGYTAQRDGSTLEYQVAHPRWRVWEAETAELQCDIAGLYGESFCEILKCPPASAFLAEGSAVKVSTGVRLNFK